MSECLPQGPAPSLTSVGGGSTCASKSNSPCRFPYKHTDGSMRSECFNDGGQRKCYTRLKDDYTVRMQITNHNSPKDVSWQWKATWIFAGWTQFIGNLWWPVSPGWLPHPFRAHCWAQETDDTTQQWFGAVFNWLFSKRPWLDGD